MATIVRTDVLREGGEQLIEIFGTHQEAKDWISAKIEIAMKTATASNVRDDQAPRDFTRRTNWRTR